MPSYFLEETKHKNKIIIKYSHQPKGKRQLHEQANVGIKKFQNKN